MKTDGFHQFGVRDAACLATGVDKTLKADLFRISKALLPQLPVNYDFEASQASSFGTNEMILPKRRLFWLRTNAHTCAQAENMITGRPAVAFALPMFAVEHLSVVRQWEKTNPRIC